jgi:release factor glutamine methyltransferase
VSPDVLMPRPETELLVEQAPSLRGAGRPVAMLELGTGSGAIAIAVSREAARGAVEVTAADVSSRRARGRAQRNAERLGRPGSLGRATGTPPVGGRFHLIVSNPPYVAGTRSPPAALRHEPALALVAGRDGLDAIRRIVAGAPVHLHPGGWLALEHGFDQGPLRCARLGHDAGFERNPHAADLAGLERVTAGRWRKT